MQINRTIGLATNRSQVNFSPPSEEITTSQQTPSESFSFSESEKTPTLVKAGKYALAAATTFGAGALALYAGNNVGTAATVAGVASGALAGATVLGTVGLFADLAGGFMSNSDCTKPMAIGGAAAGAAGGAFVGAAMQSPVAGIGMALASGASALWLTGMVTNIGAD